MADSVINEMKWILAVSLLNLFAVCSSLTFEGSSTSYAKFSSWVPCHNGSISFEFKTSIPDSLLLYTDSGNKKISDDYFELKLINGIMHLVFKINQERNMIHSAKDDLNDNNWHMVDLIREGRLTTLRVDGVARTVEDKFYQTDHVTFGDSPDSFVYIGGLPVNFNHRLEKLAHAQANFEQHLRGSIRNLFYSNCGKALVTPQLLMSEGTISDTDKCMENNPCQNNGICIMRDKGVQCDCSWTDFHGDFCEQGETSILEIIMGCLGNYLKNSESSPSCRKQYQSAGNIRSSYLRS